MSTSPAVPISMRRIGSRSDLGDRDGDQDRHHRASECNHHDGGRNSGQVATHHEANPKAEAKIPTKARGKEISSRHSRYLYLLYLHRPCHGRDTCP